MLIKADKLKHGITYTLMAIQIGNEIKIINTINNMVTS